MAVTPFHSTSKRHRKPIPPPNLAASEIFEHPTACGDAPEQDWVGLLNRYLPQREPATSAFLIDADGHRSRQIDIAIYDRFYSPLLFHDDAGRKAASVRRLRRTSAPIPAAGPWLPPKPPFPISPESSASMPCGKPYRRSGFSSRALCGWPGTERARP